MLTFSSSCFANGLLTNHFCQTATGFHIDEIVITKCFTTGYFEDADEICRQDYKSAFPNTSLDFLSSKVKADSFFSKDDCKETLTDSMSINLEGQEFKTKRSSDGKRTILYYRYPGFSGN